ncbi:MAG: hypothetical protein C4522_12630 [Desulfobacteraceae bacterium]|nr:MAG: hypothetical protein C4522_12630 [Desulfobacteraceae bacterium]
MKGDIYTREKCPVCYGRLVHDEKRNGCFCTHHPQCSSTKYFVRFEKLFKNFQNYFEAYQFLQGLRFKFNEGTFDAKDYRKDSPMGFSTLADQYVKMKEQDGLRSIQNIRNYMKLAKNYFGQKNVKEFKRPDIRNFLFGLNVSSKTRHNYMSCLHDFFYNLYNDDIISISQIPNMPKIEFELEYRTLTDLETQEKIISKVKEISYNTNPKIWLGIDMLSLYTNIRPKDLLGITETDIDLDYGIIEILRPTKKRNKLKKVIIRLVEAHIDIIKDIKKRYPALPHISFFRHHGGVSGCNTGQPFGEKLFYKWWKKACDELGIKGLDLYGGTRHTTTTALAKEVGRDGAKKASQHGTNKAFERYCQAHDDETFKFVKIAEKMKKGNVLQLKRKAGS